MRPRRSSGSLRCSLHLSTATDLRVRLPLNEIRCKDVLRWPIRVISQPFDIHADLTFGYYREVLTGHQALHTEMGASGRDYGLEVCGPLDRQWIADLGAIPG
jgi:hypothetical protein